MTAGSNPSPGDGEAGPSAYNSGAAPGSATPGSAAPGSAAPGSAAPGSAAPGSAEIPVIREAERRRADDTREPYPDHADLGVEPAWPGAAGAARRPGRAAAVAAAIAFGVAALGAPLGLLWAALAPTIPVRMTDDGAVLVEAQPEEFAAADVWFTLLGLGFGALAALAVWLVARRLRGPLPLLAVTLGAVAAGLLAWWLGRQIGVADYERLLAEAPEGTVFGKPADLRAAEADLWLGFLPVVRGNALIPALGAAVAYTLLAGWSRYSTLRPHEEPLPVEPYRPEPYRPEPYNSEPYHPEPHQPGLYPAGPYPVARRAGETPPAGAGVPAPPVSSGRPGPVSSGWTAPPDPPAAPAPPGRGAEGPSPG